MAASKDLFSKQQSYAAALGAAEALLHRLGKAGLAVRVPGYADWVHVAVQHSAYCLVGPKATPLLQSAGTAPSQQDACLNGMPEGPGGGLDGYSAGHACDPCKPAVRWGDLQEPDPGDLTHKPSAPALAVPPAYSAMPSPGVGSL